MRLRTRFGAGAAAVAVAAGVAVAVQGQASAAETAVSADRACGSPVIGSVHADLTGSLWNMVWVYPQTGWLPVRGGIALPSAGLAAAGAATVDAAVDVGVTITNGSTVSHGVVSLLARNVPVTAGQDITATDLLAYTPDMPDTLTAASPLTFDVADIAVRVDAKRADGSALPRTEVNCTGGTDRWAQWDRLQGGSSDTWVGSAVTDAKVTSDSIALTWTESGSIWGDTTGYRVTVDEGATPALVTTGPQLTGTLTGLQPDTDHWITIQGLHNNYPITGRGKPVRIRTAPAPSADTELHYTATGTAKVKKIGANVALSGTADSLLTAGTGAHTTTLALDPTTVKATIAGIIPITADVTLTPTGPVTGTLADGALTASATVDIGLSKVTFAGFPLTTGNTCHTHRPAEVNLTAAGFTPSAGGTLTGSFAIPELTGCGSATPLLSAFVAGSGNTASLTLAPRA
ncbi:fibronectin type III domain-containing protein [Actinokineospora spheciospongiae]|uniref:fibronectin type III domain-containing protein n=1 Tax=Actinokineospora spheciospongiae TaxID=909613 RepID=UPI0004B7C24B|nr:fibronectin type III domain-containing protein [Actinokineospora spheciospongiae]